MTAQGNINQASARNQSHSNAQCPAVTRRPTSWPARIAAYTLIELVVVVAIIGILSAVAYPSYTSYVKRANRADAMELINEVMAQQQRYVLRKRTYTADLRDLGYDSLRWILSSDGFYRIRADACDGGVARCIQVTARPVVGTVQEGDGDITLDSRGIKTWNGQQGWYHRD